MNKNKEILLLSEEILKNIELSEMPFADILLKSMRLARISWDQNAMTWFTLELNWYDGKKVTIPETQGQTKESIANTCWRWNIQKDWKWIDQQRYYTSSIPEIESIIMTEKIKLDNLKTPQQYSPNSVYDNYSSIITKISIDSNLIQSTINTNLALLSRIKSSVYKYILSVNYKYKYGNTIYEILDSIKSNMTKKLQKISPESMEILSSIYDNLNSDNKTDWSNAIHNCRRVFYSISNILYPPSEKEIEIKKWKKIEKRKLSDENYIMRLKQYIKEQTKSETFNKIIWSSLDFFWERIDALYKSSTKWWHIIIKNKEEAERYVIYTFMLLNDILSL